MILVLGVFSCAILCIRIIPNIVNGFKALESSMVAQIALYATMLVWVIPCMLYFIHVVGQYDERLQKKQHDARQQKENLTKSYNELLSDMDGLLAKSAESSAGLAERSFESKRRDFQRFLERAKSRYGGMYSGTKGDCDQLLKQFRRFVVNWFAVFEECSIDPIHTPKHVVSSEELNRCTSISEVCDLCLERLRVTEVRFISIQRDQDAQMLRRNRNELKRLSNATALRGRPSSSADVLPSVRSISADLLAPADNRGVSWLSFGRGHGFRTARTESAEDGFPKEVRFGCGRLVLLSKEHVNLIWYFGAGWVLMGFVILVTFTEWIQTVGDFVIYFSFIELCVVTVLIRFEELDVIQQLEREVSALKQAAQNVTQQRDKMVNFWSNAQQLTELWLYRTVPRLDLFKELHSQLEDEKEDLLVNMAGANQLLEDLDRNLGALEAWRNDGTLQVEEKKAFGKVINQLCQEQEFEEILVKLEEITKTRMKVLEALPPNAPRVSFHSDQLNT